jgi:hypothetical protein
MNFRRITVVLSLVVLLTSCNVEQPMRWQTTNQVEFDLLVVQMPEATAVPLIPELRDKKRSAKASEMVIKLIKENKATLIGWPVLATKSGQRAVVEQIDEFRYATEYDPPGRTMVTKTVPGEGNSLPPTKNNPPQIESTVETVAGSLTATSLATPVPPDESAKVNETITSISEGIPTAFETRNIGVMLEIEPVVGPDGRTIDLNLVPQHVRFLGMRKAQIETADGKNKSVVEQPEFLTNKVTTSVQVEDGEHTLLGVFKVNEPPGTVEFFILHSRLKRIEVPVGRAKTMLSPGDPQPNGFGGPGGAGLGP